MPLITAYDGITVQHVGELYTDNDSTRGLHSRAFPTYLRALHDISFGIVLSDQIVLARSYPRYAGTDDAPGYDLHNLLLRLDEGIFARKTPPQKSEVVLAKSGGSVPDAVRRAAQESIQDPMQKSSWRNFVLRELKTYFPASAHYQDCEIGLDDRGIIEMFGDLKKKIRDPVTDTTFVKFVKLALGAHILRDYNTSTLKWDMPGPIVRIPHETRADVHLKRLESVERQVAEQNIRCWVAPQLLGHALVRPGLNPPQFFEELLQLRMQDPFKSLRRRLSSGLAEWEDRRSAAGLNALAQEVEAFGRKTEMPPILGDYVAQGTLESPEILGRVFRFPQQEVLNKLRSVFTAFREEGGVDKSLHISNSKNVVGITGDGVTISNTTLAFQESFNNPQAQETLISELMSLRDRLLKEAPSLDRDLTIGDLARAEEAARGGRWDQVLDALKHGGIKLLELTAGAGLTVAAEAVRKSLGLP